MNRLKKRKKSVRKMATAVVGTQYTKGKAQAEEHGHLHREPDNPYDPNAIMVLNCKHKLVGYIPKDDAEILAPIMDRRKPKVTICGVFGQNRRGRKSYPLTVYIETSAD